MIVLTAEQATAVRGISPIDGLCAIAPRLLTDGSYALNEACIDDPAHADVKSVIEGLTTRSVASNEWETNGTLLNAVPYWRTVGVRSYQVVEKDVPEGTDNGAILHTAAAAPTLSNSTGGMGVDGNDIVITDKAAFFAAAEPKVDVQTASGAFRLSFTKVAGHYDIGVMQANLCHWWDMGDHRQFSADEDSDYVEIWKDKSDFERHMRNPWIGSQPAVADRRPTLIDSTLSSGRKGALNVFSSTGATYGLACPEAPIWHGVRYIRIPSASSIEITAGDALSNDFKTIFSGLSSTLTPLLDQPILIVIYGDDTECALRINGVEIATKTVAQGYIPPPNPFLFVWAGKISGYNTLIAPSHVGQHPFWEGAALGGEMAEIIQLLNVEVV